MKRGASVLGQVGGLAITALVAAILISFGVVLATPEPPARLMTIADAAAVLNGETRAGLEHAVTDDAPRGRVTGLIGRAIAARLGVAPDRVRAAWRPAREPGEPPREGQTVMIVAGQDVVIDSQQGGFTMRSGTAASVSPDARVPPFEAGLRQPDGRWHVVRPTDPLLAAWRVRLLVAFLLGSPCSPPLSG